MRTAVACAGLTLIGCATANAEIVDFECIPAQGIPAEGTAISDQYEETLGVVFSLEDGESPVIAEVGTPKTAFDPSDTPLEDRGVEQFFLTDDGLTSGLESPPLIVTYSTPTAEAGGVILDIDHGEEFTIEARDAGGGVLETVVIRDGDPPDRRPLRDPVDHRPPIGRHLLPPLRR
jgi:hypothetical protein